MNVLITGSSGFLGQHVVEALRGTGAPISLTGFDRPGQARSRVDEAIEGDLGDESEVRQRVAGRTFDVCIHLAGVSAGSPASLYRANVEGTANLLECLACRPPSRLVVVSSSSVYGRGSENGDVDERTPLDPLTPYAQSFVAREMAARLFARERGADLIVLRLFNLVGPGQRDTMMVPALARQIAQIEKGLQPRELIVGRLDTARDYVDVRDAAAAIVSLVTGNGSFAEVINLGSGTVRSGAEVVAALLALTACRPEVTTRHDSTRTEDVIRICNASTLARTRIPWAPVFPFERSLRDTLDDWRGRVSEHSRCATQ